MLCNMCIVSQRLLCHTASWLTVHCMQLVACFRASNNVQVAVPLRSAVLQLLLKLCAMYRDAAVTIATTTSLLSLLVTEYMPPSEHSAAAVAVTAATPVNTTTLAVRSSVQCELNAETKRVAVDLITVMLLSGGIANCTSSTSGLSEVCATRLCHGLIERYVCVLCICLLVPALREPTHLIR